MELNRFRELLESTMGNVKPLIMEQVTGNTPTIFDSSWFEKTPNGTIETINRKPSLVNGQPVGNSFTTVIGDYNSVPDKRLYGTKTWNYTLDTNKKSLSLKDSQGYGAYLKI
jgi:hypothetical protein